MSVRSVLVLSRHSLRRIRAILLGIGVLLAAFQFLLTEMGVYFFRRAAFTEMSMLMPDFIRNLMGPSTLAFMSFTGIVAFGYFHPMVVAAVVGLTIAIASEPAAEVELRFVDLTLSRELTRTTLMARTCLVFAAAALFVLTLMVAATEAGLACCTPLDVPRPAASLIGALAVSLGSVMVCWAGITLGAAACARRRAVVGGAVGVAALAAFLLDYVGRAWTPAAGIGRISPFHYFEPTSLIMGSPLSLTNLAVLFGVGIVGFVIAYVVFNRRDI